MIAGGTPYTGTNPDTLNLWGPYSSGSHKMENAYMQGARGVLYLDKLANPGAHLDGQGYLGFHFPGALDNASGVADLLAAARALSESNGQMKRSVVFIFFGAEEVGLVGSTIYCQNPAFPPEKTLLFMQYGFRTFHLSEFVFYWSDGTSKF